MKILNNKVFLKVICIMLVFLTIFISVIPNYSIATDEKVADEIDTETGGKLFRPIFKLAAGVGDLVLKTLQWYFYADFDIKDNSTGEFDYKYGPAAIFSGIIPGLDANFINPSEEKIIEKDVKFETEMLSTILEKSGELKEGPDNYARKLYGVFDTNVGTTKKKILKKYKKDYNYDQGQVVSIDAQAIDNIKKQNQTALSTQEIENIETAWSIINGDNIEIYIVVNTQTTITESNLQQTVNKSLMLFLYKDTIDNLNNSLQNAGKVVGEATNIGTKTSTAKELQKTISKWYKALRLIALVGLLSVLVYVGIRIIISSTGQEKAKYKKMIVDWLAAICILFILQYIMAFTMNIVDDILDIFKDNKNIISGRVVDADGVIQDPGTDVLLSSIRGEINTSDAYSNIFSSLVIYLVLVIYSVIFTIHYLKRLVYLAFFTMIAPLIALTYPLDKIKDGQAQAFGMWIKEYIFNALIPVMHIVLYSIFVGSAMDFAKTNPIYALVCIGFLIPAEKFFRKMFGFDKATTSGQLGAAAGGAMVMNAINKISHGGGSGSGGAKSSSSPKTNNNRSGYIPAPGADPQQNNPQQNNPQQNNPQQNNPQQNNPQQNNPQQNNPSTFTALGNTYKTGRPKPKPRISGRLRGLKGVAGRYINRGTGRKLAMGAGRLARKGLVGAAGAAALGTFGLAAGIATGDLSKVAQYTGAAGAVGFSAANKVGNKLTEVEKANRETYKENKWGTDEYNIREQTKELNRDPEFRKSCKAAGLDADQRKDIIRKCHANGITNPDSIIAATTALAGQKQQGHNWGIDETVALAKMNQGMTKSYWGQPQNRTKFINDLTTQLGGDGNKAAQAAEMIDSMKGDLG